MHTHTLNTVKPEEIVNEREYEVRRKKKFAELLVAIKTTFRDVLAKDSRQFEELREFVSTLVPNTHRLAILTATTTDAIFCQLSVGDYITENNTALLHPLLQLYGNETVSQEQHGLAEFELQRDFVQFSLRVAGNLTGKVTANELKLCILCTAVRFGCHYKTLEQEHDVGMMIRILSDWKHPELLRRVVRHFCPEQHQRLDRYTAKMVSVSRQFTVAQKPEKLHLSFLESYADLVNKVYEYFKQNPQTFITSLRLSTESTSLRLITDSQDTVSGALLALMPFSSYHNTYLITYIINNFCNDTSLRDEVLRKTAKWELFTNHVFISNIYDVQLNCLPLQLTERNVVTLTLHMKGERWKKPVLVHALNLALATATAFRLEPWSIVYRRTVFTGNESGSKGDCKVEMLAPATAACIVLRDGTDKQNHWQAHSITYLELNVENRCYLSSEPGNIAHMFHSAQLQKYFTPYFEELNNCNMQHDV